MSDIAFVETAVSNPIAPDTPCQACLARLSDLQTPRWRQALARCESVSRQLLESRRQWMTPDYPWRIDPLHCWSRVWEYPFALGALESAATTHRLTIIDVGPGASFYAPLLATLGHDIYGVDLDPSVVRTGQRLASFARTSLSVPASSMHYVVGDAHSLPFEDASADIVQSLSVLEHIPRPHAIVPELARVLRPGGTIILTIDLGLHGKEGLDPAALQVLLDVLDEHFDLRCETAGQIFHAALHDADTLTNFTSPKSIRRREQVGPHHPTREVNHWPPIAAGMIRPVSIPRALARAKSRNQPLLAVYAVAARKRPPTGG